MVKNEHDKLQSCQIQLDCQLRASGQKYFKPRKRSWKPPGRYRMQTIGEKYGFNKRNIWHVFYIVTLCYVLTQQLVNTLSNQIPKHDLRKRPSHVCVGTQCVVRYSISDCWKAWPALRSRQRSRNTVFVVPGCESAPSFLSIRFGVQGGVKGLVGTL